MNLVISTTVRRSGRGEPTGHILTVDTEKWEVTGQCQFANPAFLEHDQNPRGGLRGAKGVAVVDNHVWIANSSHVRQYDLSWRLVQSVSHHACSLLHDIVWHEDTLWATSAGNDALLQFDRSGRLLNTVDCYAQAAKLPELRLPRSPVRTPDEFLSGRIDYRDPRTHNPNTSERLHINSLCFLPGGDMLISLGRITSQRMFLLWKLKTAMVRAGVWLWFADLNKALCRALKKAPVAHSEMLAIPGSYRCVLMRLPPGGNPRVLLQIPNTLVPCHSLLPLRDGTALYSNTHSGEILRVDTEDGTVRDRIFVDRAFLRGSVQLSPNTVAVGSQNHLFLLDLTARKVLRTLRLHEDHRVAVFSMGVLPAGMAPLPASLAE